MSAASSRRYLSLWLRRLSTDRLTRPRSPGTSGEPLVVAAEVKSALRLAAVNDAAARLGLKVGMTLADARAMYPAIAVADADPAADRRLLAAIADWCDRYTPLVGLDRPDGLVLDITGCAHLFGGEVSLARDLLRRLAAQGFQAHATVAGTVGCASAMARYDDSNCSIVLASEMRAALLPLPLAALRIPAETTEALAQVGLKRIADVIEHPRAPLAARFGEAFLRRLDQALGREDESITPRLPVPAYVAEQRFGEPILLEADVLATIAHLAQQVATLLERRGEGACALEVALFRTDGKVRRIAAGTGAPLRDAARIRALFVERLAALGDECDPGFGFDVIRLAVLAAERSDPAQTGLAAPDHEAEFAHLIDRLGARFGLRRVTQLVPQDTHIPEFAVAAVPAVHGMRQICPGRSAACSDGEAERNDALQTRDRKAACLGGPGSAVQHSTPSGATRCAASGTSRQSDSLAPIRPIHLFERPERIEAMAEVPDGPPVQFIWRRLRHHVAHAEGPERIAMPWWRDETGRALTRDYFRIESNKGVRVWLYREGLYGRESGVPRWFLHGVFA